MVTTRSRMLRFEIVCIVCIGALFFLSAVRQIPLREITRSTVGCDVGIAAHISDPYQESSGWSFLPKQSSMHNPSAKRANATFIVLARNTDTWGIARSIRGVEDRFNRHYNYDWVFLNDAEFTEEFKNVTSTLVSGTAHYGKIPEEHWSFPSWIDQAKAEQTRETMRQKGIQYGDSVSYRHMCRFESGFFFQHPLLQAYEYYWRVEPDVEFYCDLPYDPFRIMEDNKKKYSFVISLYESEGTIDTLWDSVQKFMKKYPQHLSSNNSMSFLSDNGGKEYNYCHFWSNFEIGSLSWLRSQPYSDFFNILDQDGGFFYERWGDAPVHSIAAGLMLHKDEIHFFDEIGYRHSPYSHCPTNGQMRQKLKCNCNPDESFDWHGSSCTTRFLTLNNMTKPEPW